MQNMFLLVLSVRNIRNESRDFGEKFLTTAIIGIRWHFLGSILCWVACENLEFEEKFWPRAVCYRTFQTFPQAGNVSKEFLFSVHALVHARAIKGNVCIFEVE